MRVTISIRSIFAVVSIATLVSPHGFITNGIIGGVNYEFWQPDRDPYIQPTPQKVARPIQGNGPVTDVATQDLQCGGFTAGGKVGSSPAALHALAAAGSQVTVFWTPWADSHIGATLTYMAACPPTGCDQFMPESAAVWFKVQESGLLSRKPDVWATDPLVRSASAGVEYTIPECLAPGFYLVRHEIISVFLANSPNGAQLYPGCHQLEVTSSGTTVVDRGLVSFPGAYKATDPGILWTSTDPDYPIPGPAVFTCDGSASAASSRNRTRTS